MLQPLQFLGRQSDYCWGHELMFSLYVLVNEVLNAVSSGWLIFSMVADRLRSRRTAPALIIGSWDWQLKTRHLLLPEVTHLQVPSSLCSALLRRIAALRASSTAPAFSSLYLG